ncbi:hypothetical protein [Tenacibaculum maritimum]|uniref:hypothetical protein n=1 Tax=Tenacibaculum maritimum TaxID=107401 RepID=UPI00132F743B|nr:hypothetical protein [Tenacibaculum maritimum]
MTAKIHGVNSKTYNIAINFTIKEQEYFTLKIKTIEVTGVASAIWNQFSYNSVGGKYFNFFKCQIYHKSAY